MLKKITGILACDPRGVIGKNNVLPWFNREEMNHFLNITSGQLVIMGANTYRSLPDSFWHITNNKASLLENKIRQGIIFTRDINLVQNANSSHNIVFVNSFSHFLQLKNLPFNKNWYMIGGRQLAILFFEQKAISDFILTIFKQNYDGDVFFPLEMLENWPRSILKETKDFTIYKYSLPD